MRKIPLLLSVALCLAGHVPAFATDAAQIDLTPIVPVEQKKICKTPLETGSLYRRHRVCLTKAQWQYVEDEHRRVALDMILRGRGEAQ